MEVPVALSVLAGALVLVPPEETLGGRIRLVYAHGAAVWAGLAFFALASAFALLGLRDRRWLGRALAADLAGAGLWVVSLVLSLLAMRVVWGGLFLAEPRFLNALRVLGLSLAVLALHWLLPAGIWLRALAPGIRTGLAFYWILTTELVMHPDRPVLKAEAVMQVSFLGVLLGWLLLAWAAIRLGNRFRPLT
jgi:hypothetical protein